MSKREGDAEVGAAAAVDQQPKKKSRSAIATAPGTSRIPVLPSSTSTNKADMASSSSTTPATAASTTQYAFGARLVKESKVAGSLKEGKSKEIRKEVVLKRSSNAITSAPKDDARDAVNEKHAALLKQSNDFLEMAENFKLKAEIELLQSKLGQLEDRDRKQTARNKMLSGVTKSQQEQIKELQEQVKMWTDQSQQATTKLKEYLVAQDKKDKAAKVVEVTDAPKSTNQHGCVHCNGLVKQEDGGTSLRPAMQKRLEAVTVGLQVAKDSEAVLRLVLQQMCEEDDTKIKV